MARLDRLVPVKEVAQIGACIGREFSDRLLGAVSGLGADKVHSALEQLVASELIWRSGSASDGTYAFKHALVQEAAYASLLNARRQQLHARIAGELEANWPEVVETQPELVAHHHANAGQFERAIDYLAVAGQKAIDRSANLEAVRVLRRAIELLAALPETTLRLERELELQTFLASPLMAVRVYSAPEVGQLYERSYQLSRSLGKSALMYPALAGIASFHVTRSELDKSLELSGEMLRMAEADGNQDAAMEAYRLRGMTRQWMGDLSGARLDFARVLALYDPAKHQGLAAVYGQDHRMSAHCWDAWSLLYLGYPDQAVAARQAALDAARATPHMFSRLYAPAVTMNVLQFIGDAGGMVKAADDLVGIAEEHGITAWTAWGHTGGGWAQAWLGDEATGLHQIETGLALLRAAEVGVLLPFHLGMAADVCMLLGRLDEAAAYLAEALDYVERDGQRWFAAEAYRMMGELALMQGKPADAEGFLARAIDVAQGQNAKGWELRAAVSFARLMKQKGRQQQALRVLQPLYEWFTEGFDTKDLREAKALLNELDGAS
jgi:predicted ATPase